MTTKVLSTSNYNTASPGKFRVVQWIESEPYQLGEETDTVEAACIIVGATELSEIPAFNAKIYNDKGEEVSLADTN